MVKRKKQLDYSPNKLAKAIKEVENGVSLSKVSRDFNIPRTTLRYKYTGERPLAISKPGPQSMLGNEIEAKICDWLKQIAKQGLLYTAKKLFDEGYGKVTKLFQPDNGPGRRWLSSFMSRHQDLSARQSEYLHKARSSVNEKGIRLWFKEISDELKDSINIFKEPNRIFNCDETAFLLHPKQAPVIVEKGSRHVYDTGKHSNKESVTVLVNGNAVGDLAPTMLLYSFERIPTMMAESAPNKDDWAIGRSPNGWMTCQTFYEYIANVFSPYLDKAGIQRPVILILDGHKSHLSLQLSEFCQSHEIILIALPPNATHIMQPLDVSLFGPLKKKWKNEVNNFKIRENKGKDMQRHHLLPLLTRILQGTNFKENLINGFKACGICPFQPNNVDYTKCIQKKTDIFQKNNSNSNTNEVLVEELENVIPGCLKNLFQKHGPNAMWTGDQKYAGLFHFYNTIKFNEDFETSMMLYEQPNDNITDLDFQNQDYIVYDSIDTIANVSDLNNISFPPQEVVIELVDIGDHGTTSNNLPEENNTDEILSEMETGSETNVDNSMVDIGDHGTTSNNLPEENNTDEILSEMETESETNVDNSSMDIANETTLAKQSTPPPSAHTPHSSSKSAASTSSRESVDNILNSVVRFRPKNTNEEELEEPDTKKARRKLDLPSVLTSSKWIGLKKAVDDEKDAIEEKKVERKKQQEIKRAELEHKKLLVQQRKNLKQVSQKKNLVVGKKNLGVGKKNLGIRKKIFNQNTKESKSLNKNFVEVKVGQWIVVEYQTGSESRNFIAKIVGHKKGHLYGNFVRPTESRDFSGFVYKYPDVKDLYKFEYNQIKGTLPSPDAYGTRGLMLFCVNSKDL